MENVRKYCKQCHQLVIPKRNPHQNYCGQKTCQNKRKHLWRKQKRALDEDYRENQQQVNQQWHQRHPDYWHQYRQAHPAYTERNREQTRLRRQHRQQQLVNPHQGDASLFAKSDALSNTKSMRESIKPGIYRLIPTSRPEFAKSDALMVTISLISSN